MIVDWGVYNALDRAQEKEGLMGMKVNVSEEELWISSTPFEALLVARLG